MAGIVNFYSKKLFYELIKEKGGKAYLENELNKLHYPSEKHQRRIHNVLLKEYHDFIEVNQ